MGGKRPAREKGDDVEGTFVFLSKTREVLETSRVYRF
jgi:hypothetical protein